MARTKLPTHVRRLLEPHKARAPQPAQNRKPASRAPFGPGLESELEAVLLNRLERAGLPLGVAQYRFVEGRQFRWDRAYPEHKLAIEVNGGTWTTTGAHSRGSGIERDALKLSLGAALGWRVIVLTRTLVEDGRAVDLIRRALEPLHAPEHKEGL